MDTPVIEINFYASEAIMERQVRAGYEGSRNPEHLIRCESFRLVYNVLEDTSNPDKPTPLAVFTNDGWMVCGDTDCTRYSDLDVSYVK